MADDKANHGENIPRWLEQLHDDLQGIAWEIRQANQEQTSRLDQIIALLTPPKPGPAVTDTLAFDKTKSQEK